MSDSPVMPEELAALSPRRQAFVVAYCGENIGNAAAAYQAAGYQAETEGSRYACASRLLADQSVQAAVQALMAAAPGLARVPEVGAFLTAIMRDNSQSTRDRLRASALLARSLSMFAARPEPIGRRGGPIVVEVPARVATEDFAAAAKTERKRAERLRASEGR